jgi:cytochrome c biogenesis protein CcdA
MVGTILYVVNVERKRGMVHPALWLHGLGCVCGSALIGALLGSLGLVMRAQELLFTSLPVLLLTGVVGMLRIPAPKVSRQVFAKWRLTLAPRTAALLYGLELGFGFTTYVTATTFYVVSVWAILVGDPWLGALGMSAFGVGRALPLFLLSRRATDTEERIRLSAALDPWKPAIHLLNGMALSCAGGCFLVAS